MRFAVVLGLSLMLLPISVQAQAVTRSHFAMSLAGLASGDPRFSWEGDFEGDVDLLHTPTSRVTVLLEYAVLLGDEFRVFDPNQGTYILEGSATQRVRGVSLAGVFHHVSRHLSDRAKLFPIAWNTIGIRAAGRMQIAGQPVEVQFGLARVVQRSFVDYTWMGDGAVALRRHSLFVRLTGAWAGVDAPRGAQMGGRVEVGWRRGVAELFAGAERRIDADPLDRQGHAWAFMGVRAIAETD